MQFIKVAIIMLFSLITGLFANKKEIKVRPENTVAAPQTLYDFKMKSLIGDDVIDFKKYKGKKVVLLNVASECGFTPQYADWQAFHEKYGDKIVVLGFPANNFGGQEPGSEQDIATFCQKNYGVTFQMFDKISVTGNDQHPLYKWLSTKTLNGWNDKAPTWNFCKYVVDEKGQLTHFFASAVKPTDAEFKKAVGL
ncbi:glutathione peroxidase [Telluribacter sp. SYSU D00476]|uniref:glutathione peroxidase n=1 Tax=Telluribacter sp. SYSU D00476 TaxID=2811430 RepID=UPI001FF32FB1|nr:glutathione peroxidase [Telluribacter sp. SYSU D00476]